MDKTFIGILNKEIDSTLFHKYNSVSTTSSKLKLETKFLKNIGAGKKITITTKDIELGSLKSKEFEGFEMEDNSNYAISKIDVEAGLKNKNIYKTFGVNDGYFWIGYSSC